MKGKIELGQFIQEVKSDLQKGYDRDDDLFFSLENVTLEVSFVLEASGGGKGKLLVVDLEAAAKGTQAHKVTLDLKPLPVQVKTNSCGVGAYSIEGFRESAICYKRESSEDSPKWPIFPRDKIL